MTLGGSRDPLALDDQARLEQRMAFGFAGSEALQQSIPGVRRIAQTEALYNFGAHAALGQVAARPRIMRQALRVEVGDPAHQIV